LSGLRDNLTEFRVLLTRTTAEEEPFQKVPMPRTGDTLKLVVQSSNTGQDIDMGVIDLTKLGKTITLHRLRGNVAWLYVLGEIELPT
jgi:hypothetical protein